MYNRYHDIRKFITDPEKLQMMNGSEVYISSEEDYDIVVDYPQAGVSLGQPVCGDLGIRYETFAGFARRHRRDMRGL